MSKPLSELAADAREALDSMDDFARMEVGVDARGPRGVLDRFIAAAKDSKIEALRAEVERLTGCLATANANHEQFERQWYLERDRAERLAEALRKVDEQLDNWAVDQCHDTIVAALHSTTAQATEND